MPSGKAAAILFPGSSLDCSDEYGACVPLNFARGEASIGSVRTVSEDMSG